MARQSKSTGSKSAKRILPFAPLAIALLLQNATIPTSGRREPVAADAVAEPARCEDVETMEVCHTSYPTGCSGAERPNYDAHLNLLKNQMVHPETPPQTVVTKLEDFQALDRKLPAGVKKGNHAEFAGELAKLGEGQTLAAVGYLYYVTKAGAESVNCGLTASEAVDLHIGIGFDEKLAAQVLELRKGRKGVSQELKSRLMRESVVVEMTPHVRAAMGDGWSYEGVKAQAGKAVRVTGKLLFDNEHSVKSQNCALPGADLEKCWRATAWELHPVSRFQVCKTETGCGAGAADWVDLEAIE